jgi:hypothetical protein
MTHAVREIPSTAARKDDSTDDVQVANFAVVAFLDEAVLTAVACATEWAAKSLCEELLGQSSAGELFHKRLEILDRRRLLSGVKGEGPWLRFADRNIAVGEIAAGWRASWRSELRGVLLSCFSGDAQDIRGSVKYRKLQDSSIPPDKGSELQVWGFERIRNGPKSKVIACETK